MKNSIKLFILLVLSLCLLVFACKKKDTSAPVYSEFINASVTGKYLIADNPNSTFAIPIGLTAACNKAKIIQFSVTSPSGAKEGQQYNLGISSITIPANTLTDTIQLKGIFSGYNPGRKDTLIFSITGGDLQGLKDYTSYRVILQEYCPSNINDFLGDYTNTTDKNNTTSTPYTTTVDSLMPTGPASATLYIHNLGAGSFGAYSNSDASIQPGIAVNFDWSDSSNLVTAIPSQNLCNDIFGYGPGTISGINSGSYSSCDNSITLSYTVTVSAGTFGDFVTTLRR